MVGELDRESDQAESGGGISNLAPARLDGLWPGHF